MAWRSSGVCGGSASIESRHPALRQGRNSLDRSAAYAISALFAED